MIFTSRFGQPGCLLHLCVITCKSFQVRKARKYIYLRIHTFKSHINCLFKLLLFSTLISFSYSKVLIPNITISTYLLYPTIFIYSFKIITLTLLITNKHNKANKHNKHNKALYVIEILLVFRVYLLRGGQLESWHQNLLESILFSMWLFYKYNIARFIF